MVELHLPEVGSLKAKRHVLKGLKERVRARFEVSVAEVETSKDLRMAKVFVSVLGDEAQWAASLAALGSARGFVRHWLRHHLDLRVTPEIDFRADRSMEHAARIQALLRRLNDDATS